MEDATYYKKIIYKKNAFEDLKTYIKINFSNKKILLVSTKSVPAEDVTNILNALFCGTESVSHFVARSNFGIKELYELSDKMVKSNYDLIVSFGGGRCTDVVKYFSYAYHTPYIVCPTIATSLAYFTSFCINPYDASKSFYANMPSRVFIQESIIKNASCYSNINGLCFLHSLRSVFVEGFVDDVEKQKFIFLGMEKLFSKLDNEQVDILICNDDSNLVLMDLFIDFGFFLSMLNLDEYLLFNMYCVYQAIDAGGADFAGKIMLLCSKSILSTFSKYIELNSINVFEKCNYNKVAKLLENNNISYKRLKNNAFFKNFEQKVHLKKQFLNSRGEVYGEITKHISAINNFSKRVKSVYKYGIEVGDDYNKVCRALCITPFISGNNLLVNLIAGSGILNSFIY